MHSSQINNVEVVLQELHVCWTGLAMRLRTAL